MEDKRLQQPNLDSINASSPPVPPQTGVLAYQNSAVKQTELPGQQVSPALPVSVPAPAAVPAGLAAEPRNQKIPPRPTVKNSSFIRRNRLRLIILAIFLLLLPLAYVLGTAAVRSYQNQQSADQPPKNGYIVTSIPLSDLVKEGSISFDADRRVSVNGQLRINNSFVLTPSDTPESPVTGQFYLNQQNTIPYYYNGSTFVDLVSGAQLTQLSTTVNQLQTTVAQEAVDTVTLPQDLAVTATPTFAGLNLSSALTVANGGTGAATSAGALINLGAATRGANADITSLNALTAISPTGGVTYQFAAAPNGTYDFCTSAGNCATAGAVTGSGTAGRIAKFSAGQVLTDSLLSEAGGTVTVGGDLAVTGTVSGNGSGLTSLNASNISSGTLADARLSSNVALLDRDNQVFTGLNQTFRAPSNSATAFDVQNAASQSLFRVDTANNQITVAGNNSAELGSWTSLGDLPGNVNGGRAIAYNGYLYTVGNSLSVGATYSAKLNADGGLGSWNTTSSLVTPVNFSSPVVANDYIYVIGGQNTGGNRLATAQYAKLNANGTIGSWSTTTPIPDIRVEHITAVANGYIYVVGGINNSFVPQTTAYYAKLNADGTIGSWSTTTPIPTAIESAATVTANGYIYAVAGKNSNGTCTATCTNLVYYAKLNTDGTIGAWLSGTSTGLPAMVHARSVVMNGYIYAIGGYNTSETNVDTVFYAKLNADGTNGSWVQATSSLPQARHAPSVAAVNGYIYAIGGAGAQTSVTRASGPRLQVGASLDLVGLSAGLLADQVGSSSGMGSIGGTLTAGDANILGGLSVGGQAQFAGNLTVNGNLASRGQVNFRNSSDSTSAFQVQNSSGQALLTADTTNQRVAVGPAAVPANSALTVGTNTTAATGGITFGTDTSLYRSGASALKTDGGFESSSLVIDDGGGSLVVTSASELLMSTDSTLALRVQDSGGSNVLLQADTSNNLLRVGGDILANGSATGTTATTSGTGSDTTTVTLTGAAFANNDVILIDNAGQDYYTRIVSGGGTATLTVSPAVTFETGRTVTKYNTQNIGATSTDYATQANRFFQGYFLGGIVAGAASTHYTDAAITSSQNFQLTAPNFVVQNAAGSDQFSIDTATGGAAFAGDLTVNGTLTATLSGSGSGLSGLNASNISSGTLNDARLSSNAALLNRDNQVFVGATLFKNSINSTTAFQVQNASSQSLFVADTTNQRVAVGPAAVAANSALTVGTNTTAASGGITLGTDTNLYRSATNTLKTDDNFESAAQIYSQGSLTVGTGLTSANIAVRGSSYNGTTVDIYSDTASGYSFFRRARGTFSSPTATTNGSYLGSFGFRGHDGTAYFIQDGARFSALATEDHSANVQGSALAFYTAANGTMSAAERLRIDQSGYVGFGTSANINSRITLAAATTAAGGIAFGTDTNLYRSAANTLKTDDNLNIQTATNSTTAFQVQDATATALLTADTTNMTVTVQKLVVSGNLTVNGHLITGGGNPSASVDSNAGTGASCSVSGTDTAGKITLITGSSGMTNGTQCSITFTSAFGAAPRVVVGPAGPLAAPLDPYADAITTGSFSIGAATAGAASTTYTFNYVAAQ